MVTGNFSFRFIAQLSIIFGVYILSVLCRTFLISPKSLSQDIKQCLRAREVLKDFVEYRIII